MWRPAMSGGGISSTVPGNINFTGNVDIDGTLNVDGVATFVTTVTGSGNIMAGAAFALGFTGRSQFKSSADGLIQVCAAAGNTGSSVALGSDKDIRWSTTTDPAGTRGMSFVLGAANALRILTGASTTGNIEHYAAYFSDGSTTTLRGAINFSAASVCQILDAATTNSAALLSRTLVEANTAGSGSPNILTVLESRTLLTNEGATAENYHTLPLATAGQTFTFYVQDTDGIRIVANTADTIRVAAGVSATAGFVRCATAGAIVRLTAINATEWVAEYQTGVWTVDV